MNCGILLLSDIGILLSKVKEKIRNKGNIVTLRCFRVAGVG